MVYLAKFKTDDGKPLKNNSINTGKITANSAVTDARRRDRILEPEAEFRQHGRVIRRIIKSLRQGDGQGFSNLRNAVSSFLAS